MEQTELNVVNALLGVIEETALQSVDRMHPDVIFALDTWGEQSVAIQSAGWWYNTEQYQLVPDAKTGEVFLPSNTISVDLAGTDYVKRGRRLYDKANHSFKFSNVDPENLLVDCITEWTIGDMPPLIYQLILLDSKIVMVSSRDQDETKLKVLNAQRALAYSRVQKENLEYMDTNAFTNTRFMHVFSNMPIRRYP